jgi:AcrR family transcriptional regulator
MPRRTGAKDKDHDEKRDALLDRMGAHLVAVLPRKPSLRELASAAGVTIPTLNHYFGTREDVLEAVMERQSRLGRPYLEIVAQADLPFNASIRAVVDFLLHGLIEARVVDLHASGIQEGTGSGRLGPAYLTRLLEPTIHALEERLRTHVERGDMRPADIRIAALNLLSPIFLAALHQIPLDGARVRPLDSGAFTSELTEAFVLAYRKLG